MNSVWRSLLWKEWREHRWKLAIVAGAGLVVPAPFALGDARSYLAGVVMMLTLFVPLAAMFLGAGAAAGEQSRGTIRFLQSLPTPMWRPAIAKLAWSGLIVVTPALLALLAVLGNWSITEVPFDLAPPLLAAAAIGAGPLSLLIWMAAAGVNRSDEVRAGAVGLLVIALTWATLLVVGYSSTEDLNAPWPRSLRIVGAGAPASVAALLGSQLPAAELGWPNDFWARSWPFVVVMLAVHGGLAVWFVRRFGCVAITRTQAIDQPLARTSPGWLSPPRSRPLTAMIWKQARESAPLALLGGIAIPSLALLVATMMAGLGDGEISEGLVEVVPVTWVLMGFFVAVVAGIGVFMDDLRPGLHAFWRSRPINVDQWFAVKLGTGLLVTVVCLALAPLVIVGIVQALGWAEPAPNSPHPLALIGAGLLLHGAAYLVAVLSIVLVRQAVYAALLAISIMAAANLAIADHVVFEVLFTAIPYGAAVAAAVILASWLAVRNDWGWKG